MTDEERKALVDDMLSSKSIGPLTKDRAANQIKADGQRIAELEREKAVVSDLLEQQKELALEYLFDCNRAAERIAELEGLLREAEVKLIDVQGAYATKQFSANLLARIRAALGDKQ